MWCCTILPIVGSGFSAGTGTGALKVFWKHPEKVDEVLQKALKIQIWAPWKFMQRLLRLRNRGLLGRT